MVVTGQHKINQFIILHIKKYEIQKIFIDLSLFLCITELAVQCITMPAGQNVTSAKHQEILVRIILAFIKFSLLLFENF